MPAYDFKAWGRKPPAGTRVDWSHPLSQGLIGCWLFNEGAGTVAYDACQRYGNGTLKGTTGTPTWDEHEMGLGLLFNSANTQYVQITDNPNFRLGNTDWCWDMLFRMDNLRNFNGLFAKGNGGNGGPFDIFVDNTGAITNGSVGQNLSATTWYYYMQNNGSNGGGNFGGQINESGLITTPPGGARTYGTGGTYNGNTDTGADLFIGDRQDHVTPFNGRIGFVRLWNRSMMTPTGQGSGGMQFLQQIAADPFCMMQKPKKYFFGITVNVFVPPDDPNPPQINFKRWPPQQPVYETLAISQPSPPTFVPYTPQMPAWAHYIKPPMPQIPPFETLAVPQPPGPPFVPYTTQQPPEQNFRRPASAWHPQPAPLTFLDWTIAPTSGIGITVTPGLPALNAVAQTIDLTTQGGVGIAVTPGLPTVQGPPTTLVVMSGLGIAVTPGGPSLVGGVSNLRLFVGNVDRSAYLVPGGVPPLRAGGGTAGGGTSAGSAGPISITYSAIGRAQATFDLRIPDGSWTPRATQTVILMDFGRKVFAGCLKSVSNDPLMGNFTGAHPDLIYRCVATDKSSICDNRVVIKTYPVATDVQTMILDIVANNLNGEGITTEGVNVSASLGTQMVFNYSTVTQAFDQIASYVGATWWVDMNGVLNFTVIANAPAAPFSISSSSGNWRNMVCTESTAQYANKFYAVSNLVVQPGGAGAGGAARVETYTLINLGGQPYQQAAFNAGLGPGYILLQLPINAVVSVKVNGVSKPVYVLGAPGTPDYGTVDAWYYNPPGTSGVVFPGLLPHVGDVIQVSYIPIYSNATVNTAPAITGTCGSGVVEAVVQVKDINIQSELDTIAAAYQAKHGTIPFMVNFETEVPGLQVGQALSTNIPELQLGSTTLYITSITARCGSPGDLGHGSAFWWAIQATTQQDLGWWISWFERLVQRTQFPLPLPRYETAPFVLAPGGSLAGGAVSTNPYIVQNTGQLYEAVAAFSVPPTGQDLYIDFLVNGISVFGAAQKLKVPAGASTLQTTLTFSGPAVFVYRGDLITISVSYSPFSLTTTTAGSGSANLYWTY